MRNCRWNREAESITRRRPIRRQQQQQRRRRRRYSCPERRVTVDQKTLVARTSRSDGWLAESMSTACASAACSHQDDVMMTTTLTTTTGEKPTSCQWPLASKQRRRQTLAPVHTLAQQYAHQRTHTHAQIQVLIAGRQRPLWEMARRGETEGVYARVRCVCVCVSVCVCV